MMDAELGGDGADFPMLRVEEATNLRVLGWRDHGGAPTTRDGAARAVARARRSPGRRPYSATRSPGARPAPTPSTCQRAVWGQPRPRGKCDPSRGRDRRADDRDDRGALPGSRDGAAVPPAGRTGAPPPGTPPSNTRDRGRTTRKSRTAGCTGDRSSDGAGRPRCRSDDVARLDITTEPWHTRSDRLGLSERRGGHRGSGVSAPGPHLVSPSPLSLPAHGADPPGGTRRLWPLSSVPSSPPPSACRALRRTQTSDDGPRLTSRITRFQVSADSAATSPDASRARRFAARLAFSSCSARSTFLSR